MLRILWTFVFLPLSILSGLAVGQSVELVGIGQFSGQATDFSSLTGVLETGTPSNQLGGFSAIEYTGSDDRYVVLSDRGPGDGAADYACRLHEVELSLNLERRELTPRLLKTTLLRSANDEPLSGSLAALGKRGRDELPLAFDSEGLRLLEDGSLIISEEYGPSLTLFDPSGKRIEAWGLPVQFQLCPHPQTLSATGTFPNRGLEGLALSTNGQFMVAAMQGPLIQDGRVEADKCLGQSTRWLCFDRKSGNVKQWLYPLSDDSSGVSEILAVDTTRYLVLERDSKSGTAARIKRIYLADVQAASEIGSLKSLHETGDQKLRPIAKQLLIDLLEDRYELVGDQAPEKPEGLCWGDNLPDGRRLLIVCVDNDFESDRASQFLAFALHM